MVMFVDDSVHTDVVNMTDIHTYEQNGRRPFKITGAKRSEDMLAHVTQRAAEKGMRVNSQKMGEASAEIKTEGNHMVKSSKTLKVLGFVFDDKGSVDAHVRSVKNKFRSSTWALRDLKRKGMNESGLL